MAESLRTAGAAMTAIATLVVAIAASLAPAAFQQNQPTPAPQVQPARRVVIRGCLTGSKLMHLDPQNLAPQELAKLPDVLKVTSIRVIRNQVKALNGHEVEVTGALRAIPGMETGLLVVDSDKGKLYFGGGDPSLGQDLTVSSNEPPTIYAQTIKDVAEKCAGASPR